jgi:hypothetical protein
MHVEMQALSRRASRRCADGVASTPYTVRPEGVT